MREAQIERLKRLYDKYASQRSQQESNIVDWQTQIWQAQRPTSFDERKASFLLQNIASAQQKVATDLLAARLKALKVLTSVQRAQLEDLAMDTRFEMRGDRFYQLLLLPVEQLWQVPILSEIEPQHFRRGADATEAPRGRAQKPPHHRGTRNPNRSGGGYGVYGGYGYGGPQYGAHGTYSQGPIGVHAGIGRGGPSIGISIGRVFGGWGR